MTPGSSISADRVRREIQARFNPIRGLTPEKLSRALDAFAVGYLREASILWDKMEDRDWLTKSVSSKRKKAVARCGWEVLGVDDSPEAEQHKQDLEYFYNHLTCTHAMQPNQRGGVSLLVRQMMDCIGKKFAVHEKILRPVPGKGLTGDFVFVPLWFFEGKNGDLRFLRQEFALDGEVLDPAGWMVTVGDGIMEACSVLQIFKGMSFKDWVAFNEKFATPGVHAQTDATKDSKEWNDTVDSLRAFANDWIFLTNRSTAINFLETKNAQGDGPFLPLANYCDKGIATIWRGGDLSTISQGNDAVGASLQGDETGVLEMDDAQLITETLNDQVDRGVIEYLHGEGTEPKAYVRILTEVKKNIDQDLKVDDFLVKNGAPLSIADRMEHYGRAMPEGDEPLLKAAPAVQPMGLGQPGLENEAGLDPLRRAALQRVRKAVAQDLEPLIKRINRILEISDPELLRSRLVALMTELPVILKDVNADPASAKQIEETLSAALLNGAAKAQQQRMRAEG